MRVASKAILRYAWVSCWRFRNRLLEKPPTTAEKLQNRRLTTIALRFPVDLMITLMFAAIPVISGLGNVWIHTAPEPVMVNHVIEYSFWLLWWGYCMRVQYIIPIRATPEESLPRHRLRMAFIYGYKAMWMILTTEAVLLTIKTIAWWALWR